MLQKAKRMFEKFTGFRLPSCDPRIARGLVDLRDQSHTLSNNTMKLQAEVDRRFRETGDVLMSLATEARGGTEDGDT